MIYLSKLSNVYGRVIMVCQTNVKRDIAGNVLCVIGLSFMMIGFFILTDKYDLSIALGFVIGSINIFI